MLLQKFLLGIDDETKNPQQVLQLISKIKKATSQISSYILNLQHFHFFCYTRCFLWVALQTVLPMQIWYLKVIVCKSNPKHGFYSPLVLLVFLIAHSALKRNISNYINRVDVLILKNMLISIKFIYTRNSKSYASGLRFLWKGEIFGINCSSLGSIEDRTFHFHPAQFWCCFQCTCKVFTERNL